MCSVCCIVKLKSDCYPTRFESWSLATASDRQNVTLEGRVVTFALSQTDTVDRAKVTTLPR